MLDLERPAGAVLRALLHAKLRSFPLAHPILPDLRGHRPPQKRGLR